MRRKAALKFAVAGATLMLAFLLPGGVGVASAGGCYPPPCPTTTTISTAVTPPGGAVVTATVAPVRVVQVPAPAPSAVARGGVLSRTGTSMTLPFLAMASLVIGLLLWASARRSRQAYPTRPSASERPE